MIRQIHGTCLGSSAQVRTIETRAEARDNIEFFYQLPNLYKQLTDRTPDPNIAALVNSNLHFVFLTETTNLVGTATLVWVRTAIRCKGFIEDVVVDKRYQRSGLGKILIEQIIQLAKIRRCQCLQLTSKPERGTACFYSQLGFRLVSGALNGNPEGTNLYRYEFRSN